MVGDSRVSRARQAFMLVGMALVLTFSVFEILKKAPPLSSSSSTIYRKENYTGTHNIATIPNSTQTWKHKNENYTGTNTTIPNVAEIWKSGRDDPVGVQKPAFFEIGVVAEKVLDVKCSRRYYCNSSICRTIQFPGRQHEMEDFLFRSNNTSSKGGLRIQYWGDSVQAQMECDMRQWRHSVTHNSPSSTASTDMALQSDYIQIGCPWRGCVPKGGWGVLYNHTQQADVIFFNLGAHYEFSKPGVFEKELAKYEPVLQPFVARGGVLVVRSPSPTHFQSEDGLFTQQMRNAFALDAGNATCVAIDGMPTIIQHQARLLRAFAARLKNSTFLDIFEISKDRFYEHTQPNNKKGIDCKHFCQNCGLFRAWNALSVSIVMMQLAEVTKRRETKGKESSFRHIIE